MTASTFRIAFVVRITAIALAALLALLLAACGDDGATSATPQTAPSAAGADVLRPGDAVPLPAADGVLRVRGVADGNDGGSTVMDLATLDRLPQVRVTIHEPFKQRDIDFVGVRMTDLLEVAGADAGAQRLQVHALDDYEVRFRRSDLVETGAILATRADGRRIPLEDGGPIRVVFPGGEGVGKNKDNWIWSVDWMRVS